MKDVFTDPIQALCTCLVRLLIVHVPLALVGVAAQQWVSQNESADTISLAWAGASRIFYNSFPKQKTL